MENTRSNSYALKCTPSWEAGWTIPPSHSTLPTRWASPVSCIHTAYFAPTLPVTEPLGLSMLCLSSLYAVVKPWPKMFPACIPLQLLTETLDYFIAPGRKGKGSRKGYFGRKPFPHNFLIVCVSLSLFLLFEKEFHCTQTSGWPWALSRPTCGTVNMPTNSAIIMLFSISYYY